jgi:2-phosphosulfolactate phosphatase
LNAMGKWWHVNKLEGSMYFDQQEYDIRFEWGLAGVKALAQVSDVVIIVDVLSFSTGVDVVVGRGGTVFPYAGEAEGVDKYAQSVGALAANRKRQHGNDFSLSPSSLVKKPYGTRLVLPSPNGSTLSLATQDAQTLAGCLRNAHAVADGAGKLGARISVIAAGERWPDGTLRPALEDLIGAGAIILHLNGKRSPEAEMAAAAFRHAEANVLETIIACGSGKELVERGFEADVHLACELNASSTAPLLVDGAYCDR